MAYTITISTNNQYVNETDYVKLILTFDIDLVGSNENWNASDKGIKVLDWGVLEWSYDIEDALLVPGIYDVLLGDANGELDYLFFGGTTQGDAADKKAKLELQINGTTEYIGIVEEDGINSNSGDKTIKIRTSPATDLLNRAQLFDKDGNDLNPMGLPTPYGVYSLLLALEKTFQIVNPDIYYPASFDVVHNWQFKGIRTSDGHLLGDIKLEEINVFSQRLVFTQYNGVSNAGDFLRKLAAEFCAFAGMAHYEKAFLKKLFYYDSTNTQTLGTVYKHEKFYKYGLIDYVYVKVDIPSVLSQEYDEGNPGIFHEGSKLEKDLFTGFHVTGSPPETSKQTHVTALVSRGGADDGNYEIYSVSDSDVTGGTDLDNGDLVAKFWHQKRGDIKNCRVDFFSVYGITYNFLKDFPYGGGKFQPVSLKKYISQSRSEFEAIYLGEL